MRQVFRRSTKNESPRRSTLESSGTCPWRLPRPTTSRQLPYSLLSAIIAIRRCEMVVMRWGMVPHFAKSLATSKASRTLAGFLD